MSDSVSGTCEANRRDKLAARGDDEAARRAAGRARGGGRRRRAALAHEEGVDRGVEETVEGHVIYVAVGVNIRPTRCLCGVKRANCQRVVGGGRRELAQGTFDLDRKGVGGQLRKRRPRGAGSYGRGRRC